MRGIRCASPLAGSLAAVLIATTASAEEPPPILFRGDIEAGAYLGTEDSYKFGAYTGLKDDGWNGLANLVLFGRAPWESQDTWHFHLQGSNLPLDSRYLRLEGGLQGRVGAYLEWEQIPYFVDDSAALVFEGRGTTRLTLPPGWVPSGTTAGFTSLSSDLEHLNVYQERDTLRAGTKLVLPRGFELSTDYEWEKRDGRKVVGAVIGNSGGNPRSALVPEAIDYETHEVDSALRYADETRQFEIGYELSKLDDGKDFLTWQNPYSAISGWDPAAGYPTGFGRKGLEPDNVFHQIHASGGYDLPWWRTRVAAHASFAWYRQDDDLLPYTVNPALLVHTPVPEDDANGAIDATTAGVRLTSRPLDDLRLLASYRLDDRDNDTDRKTFIYVPGDSLDQDTLDSDRARLNLPNSYRLQEGRFEAIYEVFERSEVSASYAHRRETRSWTETDHLDDDILTLGLRSRALSWADFRVEGSYDWRDADDYYYQAPLVWGFSPEHVAQVPVDERFENLPGLRKFNYTDRERAEVDGRLTVVPVDGVSLGFSGGWARDDYGDSELGLRERDLWTWSVDGSWSPSDWITAYAWYTHERYESEVRGREWTGPVDAFDPRFDWESQDFDDVDSAGVGAEWSGLGDRARLRADYAFSWAKERISTDTGPALPPARAFPDARNYLHEVSFQAEYRIVDGLSARFGYLFEYLDANDWAYDDVGPATVPQVLSLGQDPPDYAAHLFAFSFAYEFALPGH
jgi:MtrB/PioB family decaheme-associated outer membrane protein